MSDDDLCANCQHPEEEHDSLGLCALCGCVGFRTEDDEEEDEIEELDFDIGEGD